MEKYIEVIGHSEYAEYPDKLVIEIDISVRASHEDSAQAELKQVVNQTIDHLYNHGLSADEVFFGGKDTYTPWWKRKKAGIETRNRINIKSSNKSAIYSALENLEQYKANKRITVTIEEKQPIYLPKDNAVEEAMRMAIKDALAKATCLAEASNAKLGNVLHIEELKKGVRGSGAYGDYDYGDHDSFSMMAVAGGAIDDGYEAPESRLELTTRTMFIKYRVRYELVS